MKLTVRHAGGELIVLMLAGLAAALWIQARAPQVAKRAGERPPGAVRAVPR